MTRTRLLCAALLAAVLSLSLAAPSPAADYGRGLFKGTAKSPFGGDRERTPVRVKVKGKRVRYTKLVLFFQCAEGHADFRHTVSTPFAKVKPGPAGGGAYQTPKVKTTIDGAPATIELTLFYGLRRSGVLGNVFAEVELAGEIRCSDDALVKAMKRA